MLDTAPSLGMNIHAPLISDQNFGSYFLRALTLTLRDLGHPGNRSPSWAEVSTAAFGLLPLAILVNVSPSARHSSPGSGGSSFIACPSSGTTSPSLTIGKGVSTWLISPHQISPNLAYQSTVLFKPSSKLVRCTHPRSRSFVSSTAYRQSLKGLSCVYLTHRRKSAGVE